MVYAVYKDDGAIGISCQALSITAPKTCLYTFDSLDDFICMSMEVMPKIKGRKNPRFTEVFSDDEANCLYEVVYYRNGK